MIDGAQPHVCRGIFFLLASIFLTHYFYVWKIEEMRITIEDLEALKELSDELEENHVETEKQLQKDLC